jgi:peptidase C39-like protein
MRAQGKRMGRVVVGLGAGLGIVLLVGCAGSLREPVAFNAVGSAASDHGSLAPADSSHQHVAVPFFPDDTDQCGPATLASVLTYWGIQTDPRTLKEEIYLPKLKGTLPLDLLLAAQARGFKAEIYQGSLDDLKSELKEGRPLVALLDLGFAIFPQGHYVVVTGYDDQRQGVYVHSSMEKDVLIPYERFLRSWDKTGRWTLLATPSERGQRDHA